MMMKKILNDLYDYDNLKIYQSEEGFKFSLDSILLAEYVNVNSKTKNILDLCTGNAVIPLILSTKTSAHIEAIEVQESVFNLGVESIKYNNLQSQITIYNNSIREIKNFLKNEKYDIITCNPPYFKLNKDGYINLNDSEAIARHEVLITLEEIFSIASQYLNDKGEFYLVHRTNRMDEIIIYANKYNINVKNIQLIKTKEMESPSILLVRCVKNSKFGIKIGDSKCVYHLSTYKNMFKEE